MTRVLLTNDDGVDAAGLAASIESMLEAGLEVVVVAPDGNRSAMGHRVSVRETVELRRLPDRRGAEVWSCSGTPADCVRLAYFADSIRPVDVVVSGLNHGVNLGEDIYYSGTAAAAIEAALLGIPAIAASQAGLDANAGFLAEKPTAFPHAEYLGRAAAAFVASGLAEGLMINLNLPVVLREERIRLADLGSRDWGSSAIVAENVTDGAGPVLSVTSAWAVDPSPVAEPGSDFALLIAGCATATPLRVRRGIAPDPEAWAALVDSGFPLLVGRAGGAG